MASHDPAFGNKEGSRAQHDLRGQVADVLLERLDAISNDTAAIFPYSSDDPLDVEYSGRVAHLLGQLLAFAIRDGRLEPHGGLVADLHQTVLERGVPTARLFTFAYLIERTTLDELALHDTLGATTEPWPVVAQLVRRASFDLLGAFVERTQLEPSGTAIIDRLTTLYTRPLFQAVLAKELERAGRFGYPVSLMMFDVDRLSDINKEHGYGVGDRILERLGVTLRTYFRQHDWVARYSEDRIAVLLTRTEAAQAADLAEDVRKTVEERLEFEDHRNNRAVKVTLSASVLSLNVAAGDVIDPERLLADAERGVERAKRAGRNRVERVDGYVPPARSTSTA